MSFRGLPLERASEASKLRHRSSKQRKSNLRIGRQALNYCTLLGDINNDQLTTAIVL